MKRLIRWIADVFLWWDSGLGLLLGVAVFFAARSDDRLLKNAVGMLLAEAALAVALLAVALTALSILVAFLSEDYIALLRATQEGVEGAIRPYKIIGIVSGLTAGLALASALLWEAVLPWVHQASFAISSGFFVWSVAGTVDLILRTAWHGRQRSRLPEIRESGLTALEEKRKQAQPG